MVIKVDVSNLGTLVHRSEYAVPINFGNDPNCHVNSGFYGMLAEVVRKEHFLPQYGFSDEWFNKNGWRQIRKLLVVDYGEGIESGQEMRVGLDFYVEPRLWFHMVFDCKRSDGQQAARMWSNDFFKKKEGEVWKPCRSVPDFFVDKIRNV